ncbi:acyl-CoA dehydrogenase family protein [Paracoccus sp. SCSIO 75233]|uniref:acyl-CoA dehydrogenase family protein n=1 Tax=Paracoccus sp. SCSIO 75233 TaxID=3017782 RepID=UPI0022F10E02|nr:acyl-CoA dehydrogenase family protein [Paracoccus sp. SCSIO 75233]WBU52991.1 acyl-CoA dehydrogenase family protein [Paracoccus sp. SCSIO 75233]
MAESDEFRSEVVEWLAENCPNEMRHPIESDDDVCWGGRGWAFQSTAQEIWLRRMAARGWTAPGWPKEYGGGGLSPEECRILDQEMRRIAARPPLEGFGLSMIGPALLEFGTEEQKTAYLPPIINGEIRWCQGYSEPNAGSDLAALRTSAVRDGQEFVLNGQKVWTSYADRADWIFCLVRTNPEAKKQRGITFLLFDMQSAGVSTRPIRLISGSSPFCETFFDNVRVPVANVVGEIDKGWDVAKYLLTHERETIARGGSNLFDANDLNAAAAKAATQTGGRLADEILRAEIARAAIDTHAFEATRARYLEETEQGGSLGPRSAVAKLTGTEFNKRRQELLVSLQGLESFRWENGASESSTGRSWLRSKGNSIEGGTTEIMLEIIAKQILELPKD